MGQPLAIHQLTNAGKSRLIGAKRARGRATAARGFLKIRRLFQLSLKIFPECPVPGFPALVSQLTLWGVWGRWGQVWPV